MNSSGEIKMQVKYSDFKNKDFLFDTVRQCQEGNTDAMEKVYNAYKSPLFSLTWRFTGDISLAEDLLQEIFIKIFTGIKKLRAPEAFNSWLYRIAFNTCLSFGRKKWKIKEVPLKEIEDMGYIEADKNQIRMQLDHAVGKLPPKQKIVFQLHDIQGFTYDEIAKIMKCKEGTAKSQLFKARTKIRHILRSK